MIFKHSMRKAANQSILVRDYASTRKISEEQAKAELLAFSTGKFFPDYNVMLMAFVGQRDLHNEWKRALVAYYASHYKQELRAAGFSLSIIARWAQEMVMPSKDSAIKLKAAGFDFGDVPAQARYTYVETPKQLVRFDDRRTKLVLPGITLSLVEVGPKAFVIPRSSFACLPTLKETLTEAGLTFEQDGIFSRAAIPATEVFVYMYNYEHST